MIILFSLDSQVDMLFLVKQVLDNSDGRKRVFRFHLPNNLFESRLEMFLLPFRQPSSWFVTFSDSDDGHWVTGFGDEERRNFSPWTCPRCILLHRSSLLSIGVIPLPCAPFEIGS